MAVANGELALKDKNYVSSLLLENEDTGKTVRAEGTADGVQKVNLYDADGHSLLIDADGHLITHLDPDNASFDAFARLRVSNPKTILDFKQNRDNEPLFFDEAETSGTGTTATYQTNKASTRLAVSATTAGTLVRQSKQWGQYQPGKSQLIFITFANSESVSGITKMAGYYWDNWGFYHKHEDGVANVGIRTYNTGSAVDTDIAQANWNQDTMDGNGASGITLDFSQTQIFVVDYEWLGVGRVRMGWVVDGIPIYCHYFLHTNSTTEVYMSNPNAPIRYEIQNDGTGAADTFDAICSSVISEGGQEQTSLSSYHSRNGTPITLANQDLYTPILSLRLKASAKCTKVTPQDISVFLTSADNYEWRLYLNPTIAGSDAVSWSDVTNSALQVDTTRDNTNTCTGGFILTGGYGSSSNQFRVESHGDVASFLTLGTQIDGTPDELVLAIANIDGNAGTAYGGITVTEYC